jgi:hypothetical protein
VDRPDRRLVHDYLFGARQQGYVTASQENEYLTKMHAAPTAALLDPTGEIGHLYDAKTSPQMVVINPQGIVIYDGAIDDKPTIDLSDIAGATNYVNLALEQAMAGKTSGSARAKYGSSSRIALRTCLPVAPREP